MIGLIALSTLVALTSCAGALRAQSTRPTAQECRIAAKKIASDPHSEAYRGGLAMDASLGVVTSGREHWPARSRPLQPRGIYTTFSR